mmetsp:Transcript_10339/g.29286  ORF Transcript_10339/g.29286 Transcript_10339/m.29286 type:complete len:222 (-) Transcript_10339:337-1002(-)
MGFSQFDAYLVVKQVIYPGLGPAGVRDVKKQSDHSSGLFQLLLNPRRKVRLAVSLLLRLIVLQRVFENVKHLALRLERVRDGEVPQHQAVLPFHLPVIPPDPLRPALRQVELRLVLVHIKHAGAVPRPQRQRLQGHFGHQCVLSSVFAYVHKELPSGALRCRSSGSILARVVLRGHPWHPSLLLPQQATRSPDTNLTPSDSQARQRENLTNKRFHSSSQTA